MKECQITLSSREQRLLMVLNQVGSGALSTAEAAALVGRSVRQLRRLRRHYEAHGAEAVVHGNRGRKPANVTAAAVQARVVALATTRYQGFNQQHLTEMLAEAEQIQLSRPTVRRILSAAGIVSPRPRRPRQVHRRRDRFPRQGMLLQIDGSRHDWLEGRGPYLTLVGGVDDATGLVPWACFREQEDAEGYFEVIRETVQRKGVPLAIYSDRHGIFFRTRNHTLSLAEQLDGRRRPTQFGRLLEELGIQLILARSPQAKGRVERLWGTFQDRLASELRLAGVATREQANLTLTTFLPRHNRRFNVPAADPTSAWLPAPDRRRQRQLFCFKYQRVVANDHTIRFGPHVIDVPPPSARRSIAGATVDLQHGFDGMLAVYYQGICLTKHRVAASNVDQRTYLHIRSGRIHLPQEPKPVTPTIPRAAPAEPRRPPATHPWRRYAVSTKNGQHR